jgi:signal transduction histidine kinase/ActR/RegA family two-component response regulator
MVQEDASPDGIGGAFRFPYLLSTAMEQGTDGYTILYVDDEPQNLYLFRSFFAREYNVVTAASGTEALAILAEQEVQVLLADQRMPGINGIQLLETVAQEHPETVRVLVTGYSDIDVVIDAINRGAVYRYLGKPWDIEEIKATIRNAIEVYELKRNNQTLIGSLRRKIEELDFLNELQLELKGLTETKNITEKAVVRLREELGADCGCHCEFHGSSLRTHVPGNASGPDHDLNDIIGQLDLRRVRQPTADRASDGRSLCILPLMFQGTSFGYLVFLFSQEKPFDSDELSFAEAASHVVSSVLYSQHLHHKEMKKEQFLVLGQMASMIVHDLKGPLATILGFVSLLQAELAAAQREEFAGIINQEVRRLIDMVEELLAFSKGQSHLEITNVDFPALFQEIMDLFAISLKRENIQTEICLNGLHGVSGDRKKLKKVFINLLQNAREYLQQVEGKRTIRINSSVDNDTVVIRFINNGPPIPHELLPKLFDPFFSHDKDKGTGLGLTICKKIIEEHNGSIEVSSQPGRNEFRIVLPAGSNLCRDSKNHNPGR